VQAYDQQERKKLDSYGWADQSKGEVRIPIQEAMKLVLQRGLPTKPATAALPAGVPQQPGIQMPTGSSSGRVSERRKE
ncbi:MAG: hypothetical protein ACREAC_28430, partial [Blastocatellia bacterium]